MKNYLIEFKYLFIFILSLTFFLIDSNKLGFFADDISIIYNLKDHDEFYNIIITFQSFDALRYLQVVNNYFFFKVVQFHNINNIHLIQIFVYFVNSLFLIYILKKLKIRTIVILLSWILLIFFSLNYEVVFWTHNLGMTLVSSFTFLVFFSLNLKLLNKYNLRKNLKYEILIFFSSLYSILTYEQYIFGIYFIILIRAINFYFNKKIVYSIVLLSINTFVFFLLIFLKLKSMENLDLAINYNIDNFIQNILISITTPIKFILIPINMEEIIINNFAIIITIYALIFYYFINNQKNNNFTMSKSNLNYMKKLFFFVILYFCCFIPLYFHHLSPRHFYISSYILIIILSLIINFIWDRFNKNNFLIYFLFFFYSIIFFNSVGKINFYKYQQIINYDLKKKFYDDVQLKYGHLNHINLVDFPKSYNKSIFFAHEQSEIMKFMFNQNSPYILLNNNSDISQISLKFLEIKDNRIKFKALR